MNISLLTKSLQHNYEVFDSRFHFVGPSFPERLRILAKNNDLAEKNAILVSLTTGFDIDASHIEIFTDALRDIPYRVIFALGNVLDYADLTSLPSNFEINNSTLMICFKKPAFLSGPEA